ncbi:GNAT family N-acetyltransferase [Pelagibacterium halotolerans]|uniref:Putative acetyltransferase protein n=1 Tax=Pelagibacterium halotolerans (strain DSM 22347 / JCM 15775 / CGMCC 1.7692 / B2) TaxID=1082931 RepID=G4RCW2_PELHB|nr:GNAT family N-acetyltransferase [Pelagibacterium halotolerans]AEQ52745.1 putative acetyltransferase protein [Pelagibacterium halotolerans B2]QJR17555.1 GNAT family N-acetyltransferase [Pelagibacterium halotolerans]SEA77013.1 Acetyltransferase (GNAT) family protein [Pelagibacterium halotolerans]
MDVVDVRIDPFPSQRELSDLWRATWEIDGVSDFQSILTRSLTHVGAYLGDRIIGFANMAWDGGIHGFLVDVCVHPEFRDHGIGQSMVEAALKVARKRGLQKVHVDFEPHLRDFYLSCGFKPTDAGVLTID